MKTLNEMNQGQTEWAVSTQGRKGSGSKTHLAQIDQGAVLPICNGNGSNGRIIRRLDTKDITCKKCLAFLGEVR